MPRSPTILRSPTMPRLWEIIRTSLCHTRSSQNCRAISNESCGLITIATTIHKDSEQTECIVCTCRCRRLRPFFAVSGEYTVCQRIGSMRYEYLLSECESFKLTETSLPYQCKDIHSISRASTAMCTGGPGIQLAVGIGKNAAAAMTCVRHLTTMGTPVGTSHHPWTSSVATSCAPTPSRRMR